MKDEKFIKEVINKEEISLAEGCELINQYIFEKKNTYLEKINVPTSNEIIFNYKFGVGTNFSLYNKMFFISKYYFVEKYKNEKKE